MIAELMRLYQELVEKSDGSRPQSGAADIAESKRKFNRRCSRLEHARHSFRLTRSHLVFASGECPTGATLGSLLHDLFDS